MSHVQEEPYDDHHMCTAWSGITVSCTLTAIATRGYICVRETNEMPKPCTDACTLLSQERSIGCMLLLSSASLDMGFRALAAQLCQLLAASRLYHENLLAQQADSIKAAVSAVHPPGHTHLCCGSVLGSHLTSADRCGQPCMAGPTCAALGVKLVRYHRLCLRLSASVFCGRWAASYCACGPLWICSTNLRCGFPCTHSLP